MKADKENSGHVGSLSVRVEDWEMMSVAVTWSEDAYGEKGKVSGFREWGHCLTRKQFRHGYIRWEHRTPGPSHLPRTICHHSMLPAY